LAYVRDADGDFLTALLVAGPAHGTLQFDNLGKFTYTPQATFVGSDTFTYRVFDGQSFSLPATVTIVVSPPGGVPEDLNSDGVVDLRDLAVLVANFGKSTAAALAEGDLDGDGQIGVRDAIALRNALTAAPSPAAVVAQAYDRAIVQLPEDSQVLRANRPLRRHRSDASSTTLAATDRALSAIAQPHFTRRAARELPPPETPRANRRPSPS
jgi:hypothetical protein